VGPELGIDEQRRGTRSGGADFDLLEFEHLLQGLADAFLVVDHQHAAGHDRVLR
jgi:hypothetical protein